MLYSKEIEIAAQTAIETPQRNILTVSKGMIKRVWIRWRWGSGGLCGARILHAEFQFVPLTPREWIPSNVHPFTTPERKMIEDVPTELVIESYNLDDVFPHKVWVAVEIEREEKAGLLERLLEFARFGE